MPEGFQVYIIESITTGKWYYGATSDLEDRLVYHNKGWNRSTRGRGPWKLIFIRPFDTWSQAREFELKLKAIKNRQRIRRKFRDFFSG